MGLINRDLGKKTKAQIDALSGMIQGDRVWNTDIERFEYYTGSVWTNDDCVLLTNRHTATLAEGYFVSVSSSFDDSVILANSNATVIGVVYRGGITGTTMVIAIQGNYNVQFGATATIGQFCNLNTANGTGTSSASNQVGTVGIVVVGRTGAGLTKVNLQPSERR